MIQLDKQHKLHRVASKDQTRPALMGVHIVPNPELNQSIIDVTDAKHLVRLIVRGQVSNAIDSPSLVPAEAIEDACKGKKGKYDLKLSDFGCAVHKHGETKQVEYKLQDDIYPDTNAVIPKDYKDNPVVALDIKKLVNIAEALGTYNLALYIKDSVSAIIVEPATRGHLDDSIVEAFGLVMPIRKE